jgi:hypothetical protein
MNVNYNSLSSFHLLELGVLEKINFVMENSLISAVYGQQSKGKADVQYSFKIEKPYWLFL